MCLGRKELEEWQSIGRGESKGAARDTVGQDKKGPLATRHAWANVIEVETWERSHS